VNSIDAAYFAAANGRTSSRSAELPPQVRAFVGLLVVVAALKQQQLRAPGQAARAPVSRTPLTPGAVTQDLPSSQRTLDVQKIAQSSAAAVTAAIRNRAFQPVTSLLDPLVNNASTIAKGALGAAVLAGGTAALSGGLGAGATAFGASLAGSAAGIGSAASTALAGFAAAAPAAIPLAAVAGGVLVALPAIANGQFFGGSTDPYFDATTAAAQKRAAAQAALIRQDLATTGLKFARRGQTDFALGG
jgi:hypothetical protein